MLKTKKNTGITLIALIITIVVLLILAGVTISAITGNESAMEKATEAREKDKQGTEFEAIKLAVVNSVASDLTGLVNVDNLKKGLNGIVENECISRMDKDNSPWIVTGKTGMKYKINQNGEVTSAEPVASVEFVSTTDEIAVSKSKKLSIIARGASGNITEANEVTFTSSDEDIATVEEDGSIKIVNDESNIGETVTITVIADGINGSNECTIAVIELILPKIGDFVNYSAGLWSEDEITDLQMAELYSSTNTTGALPDSSTPYMFGGFKAGDSKDNSITPYSTDTNTYASGWRILSFNNDGTINEIIHAGTPEAYYNPNSTNSAYKSQYILGGGINSNGASAWAYTNVSMRDWSMYVNSNYYGTSAKSVTYEQMLSFTGLNSSTSNTIRNIHTYYWFPKASTNKILWCGSPDGNLTDCLINCMGIRPVVTLEDGIKVEGTGSKHDTYETRWTLTK